MNDDDASMDWGEYLTALGETVRHLCGELAVEEATGLGDSGPPGLGQTLSVYDYVPPLFERYSDWPDATTSTSVIRHLERIAPPSDSENGEVGIGLLNDEDFKPSSIALKLSDWQGTTADVFEEEYPDAMAVIRDRQVQLAGAVRSAVQAHQDLYQNAKADVVGIGNAAIEQLNHLLGRQSDRQSATALAVVLGAISLVTAGPVTLLASSLAVGSANYDNVGDSAYSVTQDVEAKLAEVMEEVNAGKDLIVTALDESLAYVTSNPDEFEFPRPDIADAPSAADMDLDEEFYPSSRFEST